jgi:hypothetical protein
MLEVRGEAPTSAEELVALLLSRVPRDEAVWAKLSERFDVQLRFGVHMAAWNRGFELSAAIVATIATLRAPILFDIYAYDARPYRGASAR